MSINPDALAEQALKILNDGDPRDARKLLLQAVEAAPDRPDLLNALAVVQLQLGESELGLKLAQEALARVEEQMADPSRREQAQTLREGFLLTIAAAAEDLGDAVTAAQAYGKVLEAHAGHPRARSGYAQLLLASGEIEKAIEQLCLYIDEDRDEQPFIEGAEALLETLRAFLRADIHPREFLAAHHGSYTQFFDHHAKEQEQHGWIAEAARMKRAPNGQVVPSIPEGARPYAAVRVDLVDPSTGQVGQVGDQPMIVALADYPALARSVIQIPWRELPFDLRVSSQAPWDQMPIQLRFRVGGPAAINACDKVIGDWYTAGFNGTFGRAESGRFHYISDPEVRPDYKAVVYNVDLGRADLSCIDELIRRLTVLHDQHPIERIILGRGYLPA